MSSLVEGHGAPGQIVLCAVHNTGLRGAGPGADPVGQQHHHQGRTATAVQYRRQWQPGSCPGIRP